MTEPLARFEDISRTYYAAGVPVEALKPTNLTIDPGEYLAIMGPSGSGKSTLLHMLGCLDRPSSGRYWLQGRDVSRLADRELAAVRNRTIGFVFQRFHLLPDENARRNVELPLLYAGVSRKERQRRALEALGLVGLEKRAKHEPGQLSGGEQQRVALARALVKKPALLLADEPTGNLDSAAGAVVLDHLHGLQAHGTTVVLITHDAQVAAQTRRRLLIHDGIVTDAGPVEGSVGGMPSPTG